MEAQEEVESELAPLVAQVAGHEATARAAKERIAAEEAVIDGEIAAEVDVRATAVADIPADLLADYERCRTATRGVGVARLVGNTCQGCRLTIPSTEVERIRKGETEGEVAHCDNCGAILVPKQ
jgi:uncharacterized protein